MDGEHARKRSLRSCRSARNESGAKVQLAAGWLAASAGLFARFSFPQKSKSQKIKGCVFSAAESIAKSGPAESGKKGGRTRVSMRRGIFGAKNGSFAEIDMTKAEEME